jgi:hypothetical protein
VAGMSTHALCVQLKQYPRLAQLAQKLNGVGIPY